MADLSSDDLFWKSSLDQLAALLRKTIIFDNFVLYKRIESPDNFEVIFAKALGRGKSSGETISWGESIVSQVFSTHQVTIQEFNPVDFPDRLDHPFVIGYPIDITPDI